MIRLAILGSTGTIGVNTLEVARRNRAGFTVTGLTANTDHAGLAEQCREWRPHRAAMADPEAAGRLRAVLEAEGIDTEVLAGPAGLEEVAATPGTDAVMAGIVGAAGLLPTLAAARAGKRVLLANKEALVMSGRLFMDAVASNGAELLPIDSEHNAVFQCLPRGRDAGLGPSGVQRIVLTASGGPFRDTPAAELESVTPDQACAHPNWVMGRKISVDSATMMNKGLEVIEACWLFGTEPDAVEVVVHPQSIVHSMVEYADGSVLAQLGNPDMRTPIAHALAWPERIDSGVDRLDLTAVGRLDFEPADRERFPCLRLGYEAAAAGDGASTVLNAANEVAVEEFLAGRLAFTDIARLIEAALEAVERREPRTVEAVLELDRESRRYASAHAARISRGPATSRAPGTRKRVG